MTLLKSVYSSFFSLITDDMYLEITPEQTEQECKEFLLLSLPLFEFPKKKLELTTTKVNQREEECFSADLDYQEINILAYGMLLSWLQRQITTCDLTRQRASGTDFKFTSQGAHLAKLISLRDELKNEHIRLQRLYSRRTVDNNGMYKSTFYNLTQGSKLRTS